MKSLQQQACEECTEMVQAVSLVLEKVKAAKRLGTLEEMQNELSALQMDLGSLRTKAWEMKATVSAAVATTHHMRVVSDVVVPMFPGRLGQD